MDEKSLFTDFWTNESKTTIKVLGRIPEGSTYRPDPKSRTAHEIAWQIVCEEKMIIEALETGKATWQPPPMPATMKEVVDAYEKQSAAITQRFSLEDDGQTLVIHHQQPAGGERPAREFKRVYRRVAGS